MLKPKLESNEVVNNRINQRLSRLGVISEERRRVSAEECPGIINNAIKRLKTQVP